MTVRDFFEKHRISLQYVYGVLLIVLIPVLIYINSKNIIDRYSASIDVMIQREGLSLGRAIYSFVKPNISDHTLLQDKLSAVTAANEQIVAISLLVPEADSFRIVASSVQNAVGTSIRSSYYDLAFAQPEGDGLATNFINVDTNADIAFGPLVDEENYWLVALPVSDALGEKQAVLAIKLSSEVVNELSAANESASLWMLAMTIIVVVFFLLVAVRFWDYALLYRRIVEVDKMKDDFISMASHELNTPVSAIKGYSSMMLEGDMGQISDEAKHAALIIKTSADGLASLVEDLLNVSRIEQGRMEIVRETLHPDTVFKEVIETLNVQASEKHLELTYTPFKEPLPSISTDPKRLKQIMINLIGNAIKYTEKGKVEVSIGTSRGQYLEIRIKDTGIGMSALEQEQLFEKFYRVKNAETQEIRGTGLGLWITKRLVELMEGKITVSSIEGTGSQFTVLFPIRDGGNRNQRN